ncbi:MAG: ATP-binding protein, partial [Candidatus Micrarchaeia archaeon]
LRLRQATDYGMALANRIEGLLTGNLDYEPRLVEQRVNGDVEHGSVMIVASLMGTAAGFRGNVIKSDVDVVNDPTLTALIFSNIYHNARKSAEMKGVEPNVRVSAHENCGHISFDFTDNGMGIDTEKLLMLERGEIGFGFASCKQIAEMMGGRLYVKESVVDIGTTVTLELKIAE